jgi:mRNA-degrading endonuclease YafQ of YafQ-DinJ toxin-antitoxin module
MEIQYSPRFAKQFKKLPLDVKKKAVISEGLFRKNPFDPKLKTHKLHGSMKDYWAFSVAYGYRIGFTFIAGRTARFHAIGTHDIYK